MWPFRRSTTVVEMTSSVGDLPAGTKQRLPVAQADEFIIKGYAQGKLSREYDAAERNEVRSNVQRVGI